MFTSRLIFKIYIDKLYTQRLDFFSKKEIIKAIKKIFYIYHKYLTAKLKYLFFI